MYMVDMTLLSLLSEVASISLLLEYYAHLQCHGKKGKEGVGLKATATPSHIHVSAIMKLFSYSI